MIAKVSDVDKGYEALLRELTSATGVSIEIGVRSDGGTPDIAFIGAIHEFGTADGHIPERSFLRSTMDENRAKYGRLLAVAVDAVYLRGAKPKNAFGKVGRIAVFDCQRKISSRIDPPNAPSTIAAKGSDVPLVDTGRLRASIDYEVIV